MKIQLENPDGWWEIREWLPVGLEKDWIAHAINAQATFQDPSQELVDALVEPGEALILNCTLGWSYSDEVNAKVLNEEVPGPHYAQVAEKMGDLYIPLVLAVIERVQNAFSSASNRNGQESPTLSP